MGSGFMAGGADGWLGASLFSGGGGGGTIKTITSSTLTVTNPNGPTTNLEIPGGGVAAGWAVGVARVYAINGAMTQTGFADPVDGSAGAYATACVAALAAAIATPVDINTILPRVGAGRTYDIVMLAGAYASAVDYFLSGLVGYSPNSTVRGTATNATAASTAFAGDAAEVAFSGFTTATGAFANGYTTGAATGTLLTLTRVGGGAPALPASPNAPTGWRVRFDSATTTPGLRNKSFDVWDVQSGNVTIDVSITTVGTDVCYLEMAGVQVPAYKLHEGGVQIVGVRSTGTVDCDTTTGIYLFVGCGAGAGISKQANAVWHTANSYTHPALGLVTIGCTFRAEGTMQLNNCAEALALLSTLTDIITVSCVAHEDAGARAGRNYILEDARLPLTTVNGNDCVGNGATTAGVGPKTGWINGNMIIRGGSLCLDGVACTNNVSGGIIYQGQPKVAIGSFGVTGTTGAAYGVSVLAAQDSTTVVNNLPGTTITGTIGDIELGGAIGSANSQCYGPWSTLSASAGVGQLLDTQGNRFIGSLPTGSQLVTSANYGPAAMISRVLACFSNQAQAQFGLVHMDTDGVIQFAKSAKADTVLNCAGPIGYMLTPLRAGGHWGLVAFEGCYVPVPNAGAALGAGDYQLPVYVSAAVAGQMNKAVPAAAATNQKRRIGYVVGPSISGAYGLWFQPDYLPILSNGSPNDLTLSDAYNGGASAADQTITLLDSEGGAINVDGTNVGFTGAQAVLFTLLRAGFGVAGRMQASRGASVASAGTVTLGDDGNYFHITGAVAVDFITNTNWRDGVEIELYIQDGTTLDHNTGGVPGTAYALKLVGGVNAVMAAGSKIRFRRDNQQALWVEMNRGGA